MNEPTRAQGKEFWERCGLHRHNLEEVDYTVEMPFWRCSDCGERFYTEGYYGKDTVPNPLELDIDLNNLFKYAPLDCEADLHVEFHEVHWLNGKIFTECIIVKDSREIGRGFVEGKLKEVAHLALFCVLWEVMKDV